MGDGKLVLDYVYENERKYADEVYLTQPYDGGKTRDYTWRQVMDEARSMAAHLKSRGVGPGVQVAVLSKNCAHSFISELAIWLAEGTTVSIFATEGPENIRYVLEHSESKLLFVGKLDSWQHQKTGVPESLPKIAMPLSPPNDYEKWDEIVARTEPLQGNPARKADDLAMIIYTSGSTGTPKGVMHDFQHVTAAAKGFADYFHFGHQDRVLSYLPLAHVFERACVQCTSFLVASHVYFAEALDTFVADMNRTKPTLFISVPRLWLKFQQGVFAKMPPAKLDRLLKIPILGRIVAKKILTGLGLDQARLAGSGSAPMPTELHAWYRRLGLNLVDGYGMTEDFAYSHSSKQERTRPGFVGEPMPGVQVKFSDSGEILIKSPGQMIGYFKQPELTQSSFTEDGFFRTGDLGERSPDGLLKITGRAKELFKTGKGKYVAPAPIESRLLENPIVEMAMVSGVGQPSAYALVVVSETLRPRLGEAGVRAEVEAELKRLLDLANEAVSDYERLQMLVVAKEPWSVENGLLTPTLKIKRSKIEAAVADNLDQWYGAKKPVVWAS